MKINKKQIFLGIVVALSVGILLLGKISYSTQYCQDIKVTVITPKHYKFLSENQIKQYITTKINPNLIGDKCKNINLNKIEQSLSLLPYVKKVEVYKHNTTGVIDIKIWYRKPIMKVYLNNISFYVDRQGYVFPILPYRPYYTVVVNGNFDLKTKHSLKTKTHISQLVDTNKSVIFQAYKLAKFIEQDKFYKAYITQIYLKDNELELIPRLGDFRIIFGNISEYEKKFRNLKAFLSYMDRIGWNRYKTINLKYTNQIVCSKS